LGSSQDGYSKESIFSPSQMHEMKVKTENLKKTMKERKKEEERKDQMCT
jgi:hypothetical protein